MTPERWQKVTHLFGDALELPADARAAFLDSQCGEDVQLRAEVETLLRSDAKANGFLEHSALDQRAPGTRVGPWLLERLIGQGGMGAVWEASRAAGGFTQRAALKFVRVGLESQAQRFLAERQILAGLQHPNIGRLLDGGTADGAPYLAMEFIEGRPLDAYCREQRPALADKLKLFLTVCSAVSYAHQRLIVHRDLKPANVLVTKDGTPMLLDFGIARILDASGASEASDLTKATPSALTPAYASPEQIRGEAVTTASDVFSLGVVLYELIAGARPFGQGAKSPETVIKSVLEDEPRRPSSVAPGGFGADLDSVVLKALEKDPARRYGSVDRLAEDVRRFTRGEPVEAYEATFLYRARKLVLRHRALSALVALLGVSLLAGISATSWQAHVASVQRAKAEKRMADVRSLANSLIFEVHDAILYLPGATEARAKVTKKAVEYLDDLAKDDLHDPAIDRELATGYQKVAEALNYAEAANLGDPVGSTRAYEKAVAIRERYTQTPDDQSALASVLGSFGFQLLEQGEVARALTLLQRAHGIRLAVLAGDRQNVELRRAAINTESYLADALWESGNREATLKAYEHIRDEYAALVALDPKSAKNRWGLLCTEVNIGVTLKLMGRYPEARQKILLGQKLNEELEVDRPGHYSVLQAHGNFHDLLAELSLLEGDPAGARASLLKAVERRKFLADKDLKDTEAALMLAKTRTALGRLEGSKALLDQAGETLAALKKENPRARRTLTAQISLLIARADVAGGPADACAFAKEAVAQADALQAAHPQLHSIGDVVADAKASAAKHCR